MPGQEIRSALSVAHQIQAVTNHLRPSFGGGGAQLRQRRPAAAPPGAVPGQDKVFLAISLLFSAMLMAIAINSPEFGWTAWIGLFPLFLAIQILSPFWAGIGGALWGLCLYVFMALLVGGPASPAMKSLVLLTGVPAVYAFGGAWLTRRVGFHPFILALGWIGVELALLPAGLAHGLLAGTQSAAAQYHWISRLFGYVFLAFLIAGANVLLLDVLCEMRLCLPRRTFILPPPAPDIFEILYTHPYLRQLAYCRMHSRGPPRSIS